MISDKDIVEGCIAGNPKYQKILYQRFANQLFGVCKRFTGSTAEAEDLLQDSFVKIFLNIKNFRNECSLGFWVKRLTINTLVSHFRKKSSLKRAFEVDDLSEDIPDTSLPADVAIPMEVIVKMVNELPEGYRTVFNLKEIDGYDYAEIAEMLNCTNSTVRSQLYKAKQSLKSKIELWKKNELF